jgi:hypothetical protein
VSRKSKWNIQNKQKYEDQHRVFLGFICVIYFSHVIKTMGFRLIPGRINTIKTQKQMLVAGQEMMHIHCL